MRRLSLAALLVLLPATLLPGIGHAACPTPERARVTVETELAPLSGNNRLSIDDLTVRQSRNRKSILGRDAHVLGLSEAESGLRLEMRTSVRRSPDGRLCAAPAQVQAKISIPIRTVFIAREVIADSCLTAEVRAHEMRHVATDETYLAAAASRMGRQLADEVARLGSVEGRDQQHLQTMLWASVQAVARRTFDTAMADRHVAQAKIDTREEYERVSRVCGGAAGRVLRGRR
ncbi:MAG: hypothetical protein HY985_15510 [Magnetospirillum sp.]|nr:hypothetical protein [Magnetospirillum sp.]